MTQSTLRVVSVRSRLRAVAYENMSVLTMAHVLLEHGKGVWECGCELARKFGETEKQYKELGDE